MGIRTEIKPLGSRKGKYKKGTVLCNLSNGQSATITFYPGIYYIRAQGAGGSGGITGYWNSGQGGGSGAGFTGYIKIKKTIKNVGVSAGAATAAGYTLKGGDTIIGNIMSLGGGLGGIGNDGAQANNGGKYTFNQSNDWEIVSSSVAEDGLKAGYGQGSNSVLTNSGGGPANNPATASGAGSGGGTGFGSKASASGMGECLIRYDGLNI